MNRSLYLSALFALSTFALACGEKDVDDSAAADDSAATDDSAADDSAADDSGAAQGFAQLRAMHLSPDAPPVDVYLNEGEEPVATGVSFSNGTPYLQVPEGQYDIRLAPSGAAVDEAFTLASGVTLEADVAYTAVAYDVVENISPLALVDEVAGLDGAQIRVQVVHAATAVGEVDIYEISNPAAPVSLLSDVPFGANAVLPDLPAGAYVIGLDVDDDGVHDVRFDLPELSGGTFVNLFATNGLDDVPFLVAQLPDGATPQVNISAEASLRVLHLSPDAPGVDVFIEGVPGAVVQDLEFKEGTGYVRVPEGSFNIDVSVSGTGPEAAVLEVDGLALAAGGAYTAVAFDAVSSIAALALADDYDGIGGDEIRIQVSHAASAVGEVDIWNLTGGAASPLLQDVPFGATATLPDLPAAAYVVGFDVNNDAVPDVTFEIPALPGGTFVNLFAVSDASGDVSLIAQLPSGDLAEITPAAN